MEHKQRNIRLLFLCIFLTEFTSLIAQNELKFIEKIKEYQHSVRITGEKFDKIDTSTFNLQKYLNLFDKLSVESVVKLNYEYFRFYMNHDSKPFIYATKDTFNLENYIHQKTLTSIRTDTIFNYNVKVKNQKPFDFLNKSTTEKSIKEIKYDKNSYWEVHQMKLYKFLNDSNNRAFNHVVPEDSKEGYFQYLYFQMFGEMIAEDFITYNIKRKVISSKEEIESIIKEFSDKDKYRSPQVKKLKKLRLIDLNPLTTIDSSNFTISWLESDKSVGVYKREYKISLSLPHNIVKQNEMCLFKVNPETIKYEIIY
jgi:hypothetical protein